MYNQNLIDFNTAISSTPVQGNGIEFHSLFARSLSEKPTSVGIIEQINHPLLKAAPAIFDIDGGFEFKIIERKEILNFINQKNMQAFLQFISNHLDLNNIKSKPILSMSYPVENEGLQLCIEIITNLDDLSLDEFEAKLFEIVDNNSSYTNILKYSFIGFW